MFSENLIYYSHFLIMYMLSQISDSLSSESEQLDYVPSPIPHPEEVIVEEEEEEVVEVTLLPRKKRQRVEGEPTFD